MSLERMDTIVAVVGILALPHFEDGSCHPTIPLDKEPGFQFILFAKRVLPRGYDGPIAYLILDYFTGQYCSIFLQESLNTVRGRHILHQPFIILQIIVCLYRYKHSTTNSRNNKDKVRKHDGRLCI